MNDRERYDRNDPLLGVMFTASRAEAPSARAVNETLAAVSAAAGIATAAAVTHAATSALTTEKTASAIGWTAVTPRRRTRSS